MAKLLKFRRGSTSQHASFTGAEGEVTIDTTKDTAVVHDGSQAGGRPLAREDMSNVSSASIAGRLGSGAIQGTQLENSGVTAGQYGSSSAIPIVTVDAQGLVTAASTTAIDSTTIQNGTSFVSVANNSDITISRAGTNRVTVDGAGVDVTGNLTTTGDADINGGDLTITGGEGTSAVLKLVADQGDDNGDGWRIMSNQDDNDLTISNNVSGSFVDKLTLKNNGNLDVTGGVDVVGNITVTGTVDGVDISSFHAATSALSSGSATLTNGVLAATQSAGDNTQKVATTAFVTTAIGNIQAFVSGMILIWSGAANAIPSGWVLCNGSNSTPDLRDRFVIGAGNSYSVDATGGSTTISGNVTHSHTTPNHLHGMNGHTHSTPNHSHSVNNHTHSISGSVSGNTNNTGGHSHNISAWNNDSTQGTQGRLRAEHSGNSNFNHGTGNSGNHNHSFSGSFSGNSGNSAPNTSSSGASNTGAANGNTTSAGASNTGNSGSGSTVSVLNPYYALCYIMKT